MLDERADAEQVLDVSVVEEPGQLGGLVEGVDRYDDRPQASGGGPRQDPADAVGKQDTDAGGLSDSGREQTGGQTARSIIQLGIGQPIRRRDDAVATGEQPAP